MVALLTTDPIYTLPDRLHQPTPNARRSRPRHLSSRPRHLSAVPTPNRLAPGTDAGTLASTPTRSQISAADLCAVAAVITVGLLLLVSFRSIQGAPAAASWSDLSPTPVQVAPAEAGELTISVVPGDTLWAIAGTIAPSADRREVVQRLAERNGGSTIWAGQELVVPLSLADL